MRPLDAARFAFGAVRAQRLRSLLTAAGIAIGIAAVVLLTSLGKGLQTYVLGEFTRFGTNLLTVTPGRTTTLGLSGAVINSIHPLTLDDALAVGHLHDVDAVAPMVTGNAAVLGGGRSRRVGVYGVGPRMPLVWRFPVARGTFLPDDAADTAARPFAVLGSRLYEELFRGADPLGETVRIAGQRFRVLGIMQPKGQFLGIDLDDAVYVPIARGLELFNRDGLMQLDIACAEASAPPAVARAVRDLLAARHGRLDVTVTEQQQMIDTLSSVLSVLALAVGALGGISLLVGGVGILTIMTIALGERTGELGLLRALGASRGQLVALFLGEAAALAAAGGAVGLALGFAVARLLTWIVPALPMTTSPLHAALALGVATAIGLVAGAAPAVRAAHLDPIEALRAE